MHARAEIRLSDGERDIFRSTTLRRAKMLLLASSVVEMLHFKGFYNLNNFSVLGTIVFLAIRWTLSLRCRAQPTRGVRGCAPSRAPPASLVRRRYAERPLQHGIISERCAKLHSHSEKCAFPAKEFIFSQNKCSSFQGSPRSRLINSVNPSTPKDIYFG